MIGSVETSILMSDAAELSAAVLLLLPPVVVPPLLSLIAPVATVTLDVPDVVGVPLTGHEML